MCFSVQVETDLKKLAYRFDAIVNEKAFDNFKGLENLDSHKYRFAYPEDQRIFSKVWAPVICMVGGERQIRPMRYQLLPSFCEDEVYTRLNPDTNKHIEVKNTFNARLDSLETAKAWQKPFMNFHAVLPIKKFYEWVPKDGHKAMISFAPEKDEYLLAPCLYDNWFSKDKSKIIQSFAIITDEPRPEVLEMGHDRTPIALNEDHLNSWLQPTNQEAKDLYNILKSPKHDHYVHDWLT
jgi:putative SOS response-associated peptidase YedK